MLYGGGNDDDDSGTITYLSLRYGGKVVELNNELNGLSMGGHRPRDDIHHIDIMNNVDDGIEIWGGTVNLKYVNIWNIGDDSFDFDQGWRGKAQFGLIVQGYSVDAARARASATTASRRTAPRTPTGSPSSTATLYNFTVIGQPVDGDQGTAWRDNARMQYRNCIFMDIGEEVVKLDNVGRRRRARLRLQRHALVAGDVDHAPAAVCDARTTGQHPVLRGTDVGNLAEITDIGVLPQPRRQRVHQATAATCSLPRTTT